MAATTAVVHYGVFSEPGSGGAPVLNDRSEVIAVHSGFVPAKDKDGRLLDEKGLPMDEETGFLSVRKAGKEVFRISAILSHLASVAPSLSATQRPILETIPLE